MVRAKFRLNSYTTEMHFAGYETGADGKPDYNRPKPKVEKRTLNFTPVTNGSPEDRRRRAAVSSWVS